MTGHNDISAFILAGGKSRRFGQDKATYIYMGKPLIEHVLDILKRLFSDISIIGDNSERFRFPGVPCYPDLIKGIGPLGGIYTALNHAKNRYSFICACDMPYLTTDLIEYMIQQSEGSDVIIPFINDNYEALHAIYSKNCLIPSEESIKIGSKRIISFFDRVRVKKINEDEIGKFVSPEKAFRNINYIEDLMDRGSA
jgi:molybdopterin-guanine dinucleotide biosynthesis protein A